MRARELAPAQEFSAKTMDSFINIDLTGTLFHLHHSRYSGRACTAIMDRFSSRWLHMPYHLLIFETGNSTVGSLYSGWISCKPRESPAGSPSQTEVQFTRVSVFHPWQKTFEYVSTYTAAHSSLLGWQIHAIERWHRTLGSFTLHPFIGRHGTACIVLLGLRTVFKEISSALSQAMKNGVYGEKSCLHQVRIFLSNSHQYRLLQTMEVS
ncbi:hypothetical protein AVEN_158430-1 [Araneus ventricosus]|uniref:Uncharacterized protein n=1 Tax=Araneus ventricosus TaxID=182803 RepID=A0A4Y2JR62_ARAVE|nr:hypothetical protein AVEN_158430-1 [Araneus ventricosus]